MNGPAKRVELHPSCCIYLMHDGGMVVVTDESSVTVTPSTVIALARCINAEVARRVANNAAPAEWVRAARNDGLARPVPTCDSESGKDAP